MGKVYLVTGGAGGIGSAICEAIAESEKSGTLLIHHSGSGEKADKLRQKLQTETFNVECVKANFESEEAIQNMIDAVLEKHGKVDVLVNCAGYLQEKEFTDRKYEDFCKSFKINLFAPFLLSQKFGEVMVKNEFGRIINISSTNAQNTIYPTCIDYDATKAALNSLTRNLAIALAPHVNVNAIMPGWTATEMAELFDEDFLAEECKTILLGRFARPREIADAVVFLASDKASYVTAALIPVCGGLKIK